MTALVLQFNGAAVELLKGNTRLRVKVMKRGGVEYLALRPSYRVSGKNQQLRTTKAEDGQISSELPPSVVKELKLPKPEIGISYLFHDDGYGWFTLRDLPAEATTATPTIVIADSAHIKQAAKATKTAEEANEAKAEDAVQTEEAKVDAIAEVAANEAQAPAAQDEVNKNAADELSKHFGITDEEAQDPHAVSTEGEAAAEPVVDKAEELPVVVKTAKKTTAAKSAAKGTATAVKKSGSTKKPAAKKEASA